MLRRLWTDFRFRLGLFILPPKPPLWRIWELLQHDDRIALAERRMKKLRDDMAQAAADAMYPAFDSDSQPLPLSAEFAPSTAWHKPSAPDKIPTVVIAGIARGAVGGRTLTVTADGRVKACDDNEPHIFIGVSAFRQCDYCGKAITDPIHCRTNPTTEEDTVQVWSEDFGQKLTDDVRRLPDSLSGQSKPSWAEAHKAMIRGHAEKQAAKDTGFDSH